MFKELTLNSYFIRAFIFSLGWYDEQHDNIFIFTAIKVDSYLNKLNYTNIYFVLFFLKDALGFISGFYFASLVFYFVRYWVLRFRIKTKGLNNYFSMDPKYLEVPLEDTEQTDQTSCEPLSSCQASCLAPITIPAISAPKKRNTKRF